MDGNDLVREFANGADAGLEIAAGIAGFPFMVIFKKAPPVRPVTTLPLGRPGSELNTARARHAAASITGGNPQQNARLAQKIGGEVNRVLSDQQPDTFRKSEGQRLAEAQLTVQRAGMRNN